MCLVNKFIINTHTSKELVLWRFYSSLHLLRSFCLLWALLVNNKIWMPLMAKYLKK